MASTIGDLQSKMEIIEDHWVWFGALSSAGYGSVKWDGRVQGAHRVVYEQCRGPIPKDLELDHLCRVLNCCNPDHLEPVTGRTNVLRGNTMAARNAAVTQCPQGHPYDEANTIWRTPTKRRCRACQWQHDRAYKERQRLLRSAASFA